MRYEEDIALAHLWAGAAIFYGVRQNKATYP